MKKNYALTLITMVLVLNVSISIPCLSTTSAQTSNSGESIEINHRLITRESDILVIGEVTNNKDVSIKDWYARITFYDYGHNVMTNASAHSWLDVILPQRKSVFLAVFEKEDVEGFATYEVTTKSYEPCPDKPIGLVITDAVVNTLPDKVIVEGKIWNNGSETTNYILVIALFYGSQGFLGATSDQLVDADGLPPQYVIDFSILSRYANLSNLERCVITAGSVDVSSSPFVGYAVQREITRIKWQNDEPNDYYGIIGSIVIIALIIVVILVVWKTKWKSRRVKRSPTRKAHLRKIKGCTIEMP